MRYLLQVVQRRIDLMAAEGIVFKTNQHIGNKIMASDILGKNDAMVLCCGATWPRGLPIPGNGPSLTAATLCGSVSMKGWVCPLIELYLD